MASNYPAINEFFRFCRSQGMTVRVNRGWIRARILFKTRGCTRMGAAEVRLSIDAADRTQVSLDAGAFDPLDVPGDYTAAFGEWSYSDGALTIDGKHPAHGAYRTVVTFLGEAERD